MNNNPKMLVIYTRKEKCQAMEDKRIIKTKRSLKTALIEMLAKENFESVSITELCRRADISRITFYSHYSDKYALVDDIFNDMIKAGTDDYNRRQRERNPQNSLVAGYINVLDSILELYYDRFDFFRHTNPSRNPYLAFRFYSIVLETVEGHTDRLRNRLKDRVKLKYSPKRIAGFMCFGMLGFINESHVEKIPLDRIKEEARILLEDMLRSGVLTEEREI